MNNKKDQVKLLQLVGSRNKSDLVMYIAHMLSNLEKRVLVVDVTQNRLYERGFTRLGKDQCLYDFQGIDILCGTTNWFDIEECLLRAGETTVAYDLVIVDMDTTEVIEQEWPEFHDRFYVGDFDRANQILDLQLLKHLFQHSGSNVMKRITFETRSNLDSAVFDNLLNEPVEWRSMNYLFEADEYMNDLRVRMQHDQEVPYRRLSKQHRELLTEIVSALFELHVKDIEDAVKSSFFRLPFKRTKSNELESSGV